MEKKTNQGATRRRWLTIIVSTTLLGTLAYGGYTWGTHLLRSFSTYRTPLQAIPLTHQTSEPLTSQVVLVIISGLSQDVSEQMPEFNGLRDRGAWMDVLIEPPACAQPTWTTLLTGAGPAINDADLMANHPHEMTSITVDHIFDAAHRAGLTTGLVGGQGWDRLLPLDQLDASYIADSEGNQDEREIVEYALRLIEDVQPNLLLIHLNQIHEAGARTAVLGEETTQAAVRVDAYLQDIVEALDLDRSCLIVTSDHGQLGQEEYGGAEAVTRGPLVLTGKGIEPGRKETVSQRDIAPTIAALLGAPIPGIAQGDMIEEALQPTIQAQAEKRIQHATQRLALAGEYLAAIGGSPLGEIAASDLSGAKGSLDAGNYGGASQLADFALRTTRQEMEQAYESRLLNERLNRAPLSVLAILMPLYFLMRNSSGRSWYLFFCATVVIMASYGTTSANRNIYALSLIDAGGYKSSLGRMLDQVILSVGLGGTLALAGILIERENSLLEIWASLLGFGLQMCYLLIIPIAIAFLLNGLLLTWFIPDLTILGVTVALLAQLTLSAAILSVWPLPFVLIGLVVRYLLRIVHQLCAFVSRNLEAFHARRRNRQQGTTRLDSTENP